VRPGFEVKLPDQGTEVGKVFLARGLLLVDGLQGHAGDRQPLWGRKEARPGRPPLHRRTDLPGVQVQELQPGSLQPDRDLQADRRLGSSGSMNMTNPRRSSRLKPRGPRATAILVVSARRTRRSTSLVARVALGSTRLTQAATAFPPTTA